MSHRSPAPLRLQVVRALAILALPVACAVGVEPDATEGNPPTTEGGSGGMTSGGSPGVSGTGVLPQAGMTSTAGTPGAFGGTTSTGGNASGGSAGSTSSAGKPSGGSAGSAGSGGAGSGGAGSGGSAGNGAGGSGTGSCDCKQKTVAWMDGTTTSFATGDCITADGKTFLYTGTKAQTWAHPDCHPGAQKMTWCTQMGSDYVFMACN